MASKPSGCHEILGAAQYAQEYWAACIPSDAVGIERFERPSARSQSGCSTNLSYIPRPAQGNLCRVLLLLRSRILRVTR